MNKKWLLLIIITILTTITAVTVMAESPVRLFVNGREIRPAVPLQIMENRVMVPVRQIAEALGAAVEWDEANQTVNILNKTEDDADKRLEMLEFALVSQTPEEVAKTYAIGVMSRNGALQYALLSEELQAKCKADYEAWDWRTGASSPWSDSYEITSSEQQADGTWKFSIKYHYTDSTKTSYYRTSNILVGVKKLKDAPLPVYPGTEEKWCIVEERTSP